MALHKGTTLKQEVPKQRQKLPGPQGDMKPDSVGTKLEAGSGPKAYRGVDKLKSKKALIAGE